MAVACSACGASNDDDARFCSSCGTSLTHDEAIAAPRGEERRIVTIVFADLAGFTQRSDHADPEDVRGTLVPFHALAKEEIERFGGTLDKFIGDAAMGVFGAPVTHEDDAERAVRAALAIRERVALLEMPVRIAVNTGEALVTFGSGPRIGENVVGDVVNTASRLQGVAPVGGVVVGEATERASRAVVTFTRLQDVTVKGKSEPLGVWLAGSVAVAAPERDEDDTPLVGRGEERGMLRDLLANMESERRSRLVTLVGEPGIGKTRLVADLADHVRTRDGAVTWYRGRCLPYGESIAYAALEEIVRTATSIEPSDDAAAANAKLAAAVSRLEDDPANRDWLLRMLAPLVGLPDPGAGSPEREERFAAWTRFLTSLALDAPLVLVVEDLHWADDALLAFLTHLVADAAGAPVMVLATARPELFASHPAWGSDVPNASTIGLRPLDDHDMRELLETALPRSVVAEETWSPLIARAGGNPLFAREFVRMLGDRARASAAVGVAPPATTPSDVGVPDSVHALIAARMDTLEPAQRSLLHDAAVVGDPFWMGALAHLDPSARALDASLLALEDRGMIRRSEQSTIDGEHGYGFTHALIREVAYGQLPRAGRATRHRAVAAWLRSVAGDRALDLADLIASHAGRALELATAAGLVSDLPALRSEARGAFMLAGERHQSLDVRLAAEDLARALELTEPGDPGRAELRRLGTVLSWRSGLLTSEEAVTSFRVALEEALAAGDRITAARVLRRLYFQLGQQGDTAGSHEALARAIGLLEEEPEPGPLLAELYACRSEMEMFAGRSEASLTWAEDALRIPRSDETTLMALHLKGNARCELGDLGGIDDLREALDLSRDTGRALDIVYSTSYLAEWVGMVEGPHPAIAMSDAAMTLCLARGLVGQEMWTRAERLWLLYDAGWWDEILDQTDVLLGWGQERGDAQTEAAGRTYRSRVLVQHGRAREAAEVVAPLLASARAIEDLQILAPALVAAAQVAGACGDARAALGALREFDEVTAEAPAGYRELLVPDAVRTCLSEGDLPLAHRLIRDEPSPVPRIELAVTSARAALLEAEGDLEGAADAYGSAADGWNAWSAIPEQAHALSGQARMLGALGDAEPAERAGSLAAELFARLGMPPPR